MDFPLSVKRSLAVTVAVCFFVTSLPVSRSFAAAAVEPFRAPSQLDIPMAWGKVTDIVRQPTENSPLLIHIQEAHANYDAQRNIRDLLKHLAEHYGVRLVLLEGAGNQLNPDLFRFFPDEPVLQQTANDKLMRAGLLTGAETFLIDEGNASKAEGWGVERADLYAKNREDFKQVYEGRKLSAGFLEDFYLRWQKYASLFLSKPLREFLSKETAFEEDTLPLADWMNFLRTAAARELNIDLENVREQADWPVLVRYFRLKAIDPKIDVQKVEAEKKAFFEQVQKIVTRSSGLGTRETKDSNKSRGTSLESLLAEVEAILEQAKTHDLPLYKTRFVFERLLDRLPEDFSFDTYPALRLYLQQIVLMSELQGDALQEEIKTLSGKLTEVLSETEKDRRFAAILRDFRLLKKLFRLELNRGEYRDILMRKITPGKILQELRAQDPKAEDLPQDPSARFRKLEALYGTATRFYEGAIEREGAMMERVFARMQEQKQTKAVLITGGFHTEGLKEKAVREGSSYIEITPHIGEITSHDRENYLRALLGRNLGVTPDYRSSGRNAQRATQDKTVALRTLSVERSEIAALLRGDIPFLKETSRAWRRELAEFGAVLSEHLRQITSSEKARGAVNHYIAGAVRVPSFDAMKRRSETRESVKELSGKVLRIPELMLQLPLEPGTEALEGTRRMVGPLEKAARLLEPLLESYGIGSIWPHNSLFEMGELSTRIHQVPDSGEHFLVSTNGKTTVRVAGYETKQKALGNRVLRDDKGNAYSIRGMRKLNPRLSDSATEQGNAAKTAEQLIALNRKARSLGIRTVADFIPELAPEAINDYNLDWTFHEKLSPGETQYFNSLPEEIKQSYINSSVRKWGGAFFARRLGKWGNEEIAMVRHFPGLGSGQNVDQALLNVFVPAVQNYYKDSLRFLIDLGFDAVRIDMASYLLGKNLIRFVNDKGLRSDVPMEGEPLREIIRYAKDYAFQKGRSFEVVAEIYDEEDRNALMNTGVDVGTDVRTYDNSFFEELFRFSQDPEAPAADLARMIVEKILHKLGDPENRENFLAYFSNHDQTPLAVMADHNKEIGKNFSLAGVTALLLVGAYLAEPFLSFFLTLRDSLGQRGDILPTVGGDIKDHRADLGGRHAHPFLETSRELTVRTHIEKLETAIRKSFASKFLKELHAAAKGTGQTYIRFLENEDPGRVASLGWRTVSGEWVVFAVDLRPHQGPLHLKHIESPVFPKEAGSLQEWEAKDALTGSSFGIIFKREGEATHPRIRNISFGQESANYRLIVITPKEHKKPTEKVRNERKRMKNANQLKPKVINELDSIARGSAKGYEFLMHPAFENYSNAHKKQARAYLQLLAGSSNDLMDILKGAQEFLRSYYANIERIREKYEETEEEASFAVKKGPPLCYFGGKDFEGFEKLSPADFLESQGVSVGELKNSEAKFNLRQAIPATSRTLVLGKSLELPRAKSLNAETLNQLLRSQGVEYISDITDIAFYKIPRSELRQGDLLPRAVSGLISGVAGGSVQTVMELKRSELRDEKFRGSYEVTEDDKGRIVMPAPLRKKIAEDLVGEVEKYTDEFGQEQILFRIWEASAWEENFKQGLPKDKTKARAYKDREYARIFDVELYGEAGRLNLAEVRARGLLSGPGTKFLVQGAGDSIILKPKTARAELRTVSPKRGLEAYTVVSRQLEAGLDRSILEEVRKSLADRFSGMGKSWIRRYVGLVAELTLTGGLGALMHDLFPAWAQALGIKNKDRKGLIAINAIYDNIKGQQYAKYLPDEVRQGKTTLGEYLRGVLKRDESLNLAFGMDFGEDFRRKTAEERAWAEQYGNPGYKEAARKTENIIGKTIRVDVYPTQTHFNQTPNYYIDAYFLDSEGKKVHIFDEVYPDAPHGRPNLWRDIHMAVYGWATQHLVRELQQKGVVKDNILFVDNEVFVSTPTPLFPDAVHHHINHTVFRPGLYMPNEASYEMLGYPEIQRKYITKNGKIDIVNAVGISSRLITGVAIYEHTKALEEDVMAAFPHKLQAFNKDGVRNTNGVLMEQWQLPALRDLISAHKEKLGLKPQAADKKIFEKITASGQEMVLEEFKQKAEFAKATGVLELLLWLKEDQNFPAWFDEIGLAYASQSGLKNIDDQKLVEDFRDAVAAAMVDPAAWQALMQRQDLVWLKNALFENPILANVRRQVPYKGPDKWLEILEKLRVDPQALEEFKRDAPRVIIGGREFGDDAHWMFLRIQSLVEELGLKDKIATIEDYNIYIAPVIFGGVSGSMMLSDEKLEASATSMMKAMANMAALMGVWGGANPELFTIIDKKTGRELNAIRDKITHDQLVEKMASGEWEVPNGFLVAYSQEEYSNQTGGERRPSTASLIQSLYDLKKTCRDPGSRRNLQFAVLRSTPNVDMAKGQAIAHKALWEKTIQTLQKEDEFFESLDISADDAEQFLKKSLAQEGGLEFLWHGTTQDAWNIHGILGFIQGFRHLRMKGRESYNSVAFHAYNGKKGDIFTYLEKFFEGFDETFIPVTRKLKALSARAQKAGSPQDKVRANLEALELVERLAVAISFHLFKHYVKTGDKKAEAYWANPAVRENLSIYLEKNGVPFKSIAKNIRGYAVDIEGQRYIVALNFGEFGFPGEKGEKAWGSFYGREALDHLLEKPEETHIYQVLDAISGEVYGKYSLRQMVETIRIGVPSLGAQVLQVVDSGERTEASEAALSGDVLGYLEALTAGRLVSDEVPITQLLFRQVVDEGTVVAGKGEEAGRKRIVDPTKMEPLLSRVTGLSRKEAVEKFGEKGIPPVMAFIAVLSPAGLEQIRDWNDEVYTALNGVIHQPQIEKLLQDGALWFHKTDRASALVISKSLDGKNVVVPIHFSATPFRSVDGKAWFRVSDFDRLGVLLSENGRYQARNVLANKVYPLQHDQEKISGEKWSLGVPVAVPEDLGVFHEPLYHFQVLEIIPAVSEPVQRSEMREGITTIPRTTEALIETNRSMGGGAVRGFRGVTDKITGGIWSLTVYAFHAVELTASFFGLTAAPAPEAFDIAAVPATPEEKKRFDDARKVLFGGKAYGDSDVLILAPEFGVDLGAALLMRKVAGDVPVAVLVRDDADRRFLDQINSELEAGNRPLIFAAGTLREAAQYLRRAVRGKMNIKPMVYAGENNPQADLLLQQYGDAVITVTQGMFRNFLSLAGISETVTRLRDEYLALARSA
ncbi:MAG: glycogen/starch/alpha-glucan phosphorylase [Candidatus Omnitrophica bacterium]|nr:glycogen/starch/alpha-glucan phosphorylase [Candidatus Omnitrophota bacterium]